jgi:hypothetical protein
MPAPRPAARRRTCWRARTSTDRARCRCARAARIAETWSASAWRRRSRWPMPRDIDAWWDGRASTASWPTCPARPPAWCAAIPMQNGCGANPTLPVSRQRRRRLSMPCGELSPRWQNALCHLLGVCEENARQVEAFVGRHADARRLPAVCNARRTTATQRTLCPMPNMTAFITRCCKSLRPGCCSCCCSRRRCRPCRQHRAEARGADAGRGRLHAVGRVHGRSRQPAGRCRGARRAAVLQPRIRARAQPQVLGQ